MPERVPLLFWDVDTQIDFMRSDGKLYVPEAETLDVNLSRLTEAARLHGVPIVASADDHTPEDAEISDDPDFDTTYPPHCMHGTEGAEKIDATRLSDALEVGHEPVSALGMETRLTDVPEVLILKRTVNVFDNPNTEAVLRHFDPERIVVYGVALDICNRHAVEGLWQRGYRNLALVTDATRPIDTEAGDRLQREWEERGIDLVTTSDVVAGLEAST